MNKPSTATQNQSTRANISPLLLTCLILAFAIFFSALAVQQHRAYLTNGLDIGNVDQALWNTAQGRLLRFTLMAPVENRLALHVEPVLLFLAPFYWLGLGGPELLLIVQAGVVALGAWPVYQLSIINTQRALRYQLPNTNPRDPQHVLRATHHLSNPAPRLNLMQLAALGFAAVYLLLPTLQSAVLFDFHAVTLASTFLLFAFWALEERHNRRFFLFALLAMACKEDMPLVVAMLGLYAGLAQKRWRLAGLTIGVSALWFVAAVFVIQPRFAAGGNIQLDRYAWLGSNPPEMARTLLTRPDIVLPHLWGRVNLLGYLSALFFPVAYLALFSPLTLLPMLPTLAVNLLSDNPFTWRLEDFHYGAPLAPFLIISTIYGIRHITQWAAPLPPRSSAPLLFPLLTLLVLAFSLIYHYHRGFTPLARAFQWPPITEHHRRLDDILAAVPAGAPVFAQSNLAPHLAQRQTIYTDFAYITGPNFRAAEPVQHVLLDVATLKNFGGLHQFLQQNLLAGGSYQIVAAEDGILHLTTTDHRPPTAGQSPSPTPYPLLPTPFYSFTQPASPPHYPLQVDFGDALRLRGFSLHFNRQEEVQVMVDLEPLQPLHNIQPVLYLLNESGQAVGATVDLPPALVWLPVEQWPVGQVARVHFDTLPWHTRQTGQYGLALGVIEGSDPWQGPRLLPAVGAPSRFAARLPADATLVELARIENWWNMPQGGPRARYFESPVIFQPLAANFAGQISLLGYTRLQPPVAANQLQITLVWQAHVTPASLTRFAQLVGPDGQVYGQQDSAPDFGNYPTHLWQPGEVVVDKVAFPVQPKRPPGRYALHIGYYRPATGERLRLPSGADHVELLLPN